MNKWGHRTTTAGMAYLASGSLTFTAVAVMASTLPDRIEMGVFEHRGNSHGPILWGMFGAAVAIAMGGCSSASPMFYLLAVLFGVVSHLFMDMWSFAGVKLTPLHKRMPTKKGGFHYPGGKLRIGFIGGWLNNDARDVAIGGLLMMCAAVAGFGPELGLFEKPAHVDFRAVSQKIYVTSRKNVWKKELVETGHKEDGGGRIAKKRKKH